MPEPLQPDFWSTFLHEKVPIPTAGTDTLHWSDKPLADPEWKEARVAKYGTIRRAAANPAGNDYRITNWEVEYEDKDGWFREALRTKGKRYFTGREGACHLLSQAGRIADLAPRTLFRGTCIDIQTPVGRKAVLKFADALGYNFSGFNIEKKFPSVLLRKLEHPNLPDKNDGRAYPIIWGEHSDFGVKDENGEDADVGVLPMFDTGDVVVSSTGETDDEAQPVYLNAPTGLGYTIVGTPGTTKAEYVVAAMSNYGETTASVSLVVLNAPNTLSEVNKVSLTWAAVSGAVEYRVYKNVGGQYRLLARLNNNETWIDPEETYIDSGGSTSNKQPSLVNRAQVAQSLNGNEAFGWGRQVCSIGEMHSIHDVYISDLGQDGQPPKRIRCPDEWYGKYVLAPDHAGWPHAQRFVTINGIDMTVIYLRGDVLEHHRNGTVTAAYNGCGAFGPNGLIYDEAFPTLQWIINEHILKNDGEGYRGGAYGPLVTYSNGVPIVKPTAYAAAQAKSVAYIGGRGYMTAGTLGIDGLITVREFLHRYMVDFDFLMADDHHGQCYPFFIEETNVDPTLGRAYRDKINIFKCKDVRYRWADVETRRTYNYDMHWAKNEFQITNQVYEDQAASAAYKEAKFKEAANYYYTRHKPTAEDVTTRHINRFKIAPREIDIEVDLTGLEDENGEQILIEHYELDDTGVLKPHVIIAHEVDPTRPNKVTLTGFDLSRYEVVTPQSGAPQVVTVSVPTATVSRSMPATAPAIVVSTGTAGVLRSVPGTAAMITVSAPAAIISATENLTLAATAAMVTVSARDAVLGGDELLFNGDTLTFNGDTIQYP